jgi:hypothetical protein
MDKERMVSLGNALQVFQNFHNKDEFFDRITNNEETFCTLANQLFLLVITTFGYGVIMGSYNGFFQAISSGIKLPLLFLLALLICFPAVFILQFFLGSKVGFWNMLKIILVGFVISAVVLIAFAPIVLFFIITGDNYSFVKLLHVAIFGLAGIFGMKTIVDALQFACEKKNVYPKVGVTIFRCWIIVLAFVGMQLSWSLRPFVGSRELPFEVFRQREGNFYIAVIRSAVDMVNPKKVKTGQGQSFLGKERKDDPTKKGNEQKQPVSFLSVSEDIPTLHIALHNLNKKSNG